MAALMIQAAGTSLPSLRPLPFGVRVRDHGTNRPPEIAAIVDGPCIIEPSDRVCRVDHSLGWDGQWFQGGGCQPPIACRVRREGYPFSLCERPRDAMSLPAGWQGCCFGVFDLP